MGILKNITIIFLTIFMFGKVEAGIGEWTADAFPWVSHTVSDITLGRMSPGITPVVFAAEEGLEAAFLKSIDESLTWIHVTLPPSINTPNITVCESENPNIVYIGSDDDGIYKSTDGGVNWVSKNQGLTNFVPHCFAIDTTDYQTIYLGCHSTSSNDSGCCFKTTNGGDLWVDISPVGGDTAAFSVYDVIVDPNNHNRLFVCGKAAPPTIPCVFKSTDGGISWTSADSGIDGTCIYSLAIDPDNGDVLYGGGAYHELSKGIWKTTNSGAFWFKSYNLPYNCFALAILKVGTDKYIFAATEGGKVFRSSDDGQTWQQYSSGIYDKHGWSLFADWPSPTHPDGVLYLGTRKSFYWSTNIGETWQESTVGMYKANVRAVTANLPDLYCKSNVGGVGGGFAIHRSSNIGTNWQFVYTNVSSHSITDILCDPGDVDRIHAVNADVDYNGQIWQSTDGGDNWQVVYEIGSAGATAYLYCLAVDPLDTQIWYAGGEPLLDVNYSVMKSTDGGNNWFQIGDWLPGFGPRVYSLLVDPISPSILYLGETINGVQKSTNGGVNWNVVNNGLPYPITIYTLAIAPTDNNILFAGSNQGVFKTTDAGDNWVSCSNGLDYLHIKSLCEDPNEPSIIYAACQEDSNSTQGCIYATADYGENWSDISNGLPQTLVHELSSDADSVVYIFAATDSGIYVYTPDFSNLDDFSTMPSDYGKQTLLKISSNPTQKEIDIEYNLPNKTVVNLSIFDLVGRLVNILVNENQISGVYHKTFDLSGLPQGIYFIRLETDDHTLVKKTIFTK